MCRFAAYIGKPLRLNDVVSKPADSLIKQSLSAQETDVKLNADGFGLGWYNPEATELPSLYVNILPAWNDINLRSMSHNIVSPCFLGHVRAAEEGGVSLYNCHPFSYDKFLLMHNGGIGGFKAIKLAMLNLIDERVFHNIKGQTDSETMFALWLTYYLKTSQDAPSMLTAWRQTLETIAQLQREHKVKQASYINSVVTDGNKLAAVRYSTDPNYFLTLHYAAGKEFVHSKKGFYMLPASDPKKPESVIVASERISVHKSEWADVPEQHFLLIDETRHILIEAV